MMQESADEGVCSIENSIDLSEEYQSMVDRYYMRKVCTAVVGPGDDYSVLIHSNGVCIVSLAPSHTLVKSDSKVTGVSFQVDNGLNRLKNKVSGKLKHGAQKVKPSSQLFVATLEDGSSVTGYSPISGKLLEVNETLLNRPELVVTSRDDLGYIAIILPEQSVQQTYRDCLLSNKSDV